LHKHQIAQMLRRAQILRGLRHAQHQSAVLGARGGPICQTRAPRTGIWPKAAEFLCNCVEININLTKLGVSVKNRASA
jgi:hypothetical protein